MAVKRYYSSIAVDTTLASSCSASDTTIVVSSVTGFPGSFPYTLALGYDTSSEELVNIVGASGTTLTVGTVVGTASVVGRGTDSTTAQVHAAGSTVKHVISGRDLRETQAHYDASGYYSVVNGSVTDNFSLHGLGSSDGSIVGTDKAQTLTNKTINGLSNTFSNIANGSLVNSSVTVNGSSVALGGTVTVTAVPSDASVTDAKIATTLSASKITGTAVTQADTGTVTNTMLAGSIADSKLNQITTASKVSISAITGTLPVVNGGTGVTTSTGSGANVLGTSPTIATPVVTGTADVSGATLALGTTGSITANSTTVSATQLGYLNGATSNIQSQFTTVNNTIAAIGNWQDYTTTWSYSGSTAWNYGTGSTATARYTQIGKTVHFKAKIVLGTSPSIGTGTATFTLPVNPNDAFVNVSGYYQGSVATLDVAARLTSGSNVASVTAITTNQYTGSSTAYARFGGTVNAALSAHGITPASGDVIFISGTYEVA